MTTEQLRIEIAKALVRVSPDAEHGELFEWHACINQPACPASKPTASPCPCSGVPYLSDAAWAELAPIIRRIQRGAAR